MSVLWLSCLSGGGALAQVMITLPAGPFATRGGRGRSLKSRGETIRDCAVGAAATVPRPPESGPGTAKLSRPWDVQLGDRTLRNELQAAGTNPLFRGSC